jgi:hypothetical protein
LGLELGLDIGLVLEEELTSQQQSQVLAKIAQQFPKQTAKHSIVDFTNSIFSQTSKGHKRTSQKLSGQQSSSKNSPMLGN